MADDDILCRASKDKKNHIEIMAQVSEKYKAGNGNETENTMESI